LNLLEITGALFGILGVWLTIQESKWCFLVGIINVLITAYLVYDLKLYADTLQQFVYFVLLILGWINWNRNVSEPALKISSLSNRYVFQMALIFIFGSMLLYFLLKNFTDAALPFWDSTATTICFIAQYLVAKKKIENWYLWLIANVMYIVIYYVKGMEYYSILSAIYFIQAVVGLWQWRKKLLVA
jgi:nicotinamide mononucleotide transporter